MIDLEQFEGHTPGPWKCVPGDSIVSVKTEAGENICATTSGFYWQKFGQQEAANASLIAAAPDLLRELKEARELVLEAVKICNLIANDKMPDYEAIDFLTRAKEDGYA